MKGMEVWEAVGEDTQTQTNRFGTGCPGGSSAPRSSCLTIPIQALVDIKELLENVPRTSPRAQRSRGRGSSQKSISVYGLGTLKGKIVDRELKSIGLAMFNSTVIQSPLVFGEGRPGNPAAHDCVLAAPRSDLEFENLLRRVCSNSKPFFVFYDSKFSRTRIWETLLARVRASVSTRGRRQGGGIVVAGNPSKRGGCNEEDRQTGIFYVCPANRYELWIQGQDQTETTTTNTRQRRIWFCGGWPGVEVREHAIGAFIRAQCERARLKKDYPKIAHSVQRLAERGMIPKGRSQINSTGLLLGGVGLEGRKRREREVSRVSSAVDQHSIGLTGTKHREALHGRKHQQSVIRQAGTRATTNNNNPKQNKSARTHPRQGKRKKLK